MRRNFCLPTVLLALYIAALPAFAQSESGAVWIDVRTPAEYEKGHLQQATLIPYDGIEAGIQGLKLDKDAPIYLYCQSGGRAGVAAERLQAQGYTNVTNVGGLGDARRLAGGEEP